MRIPVLSGIILLMILNSCSWVSDQRNKTQYTWHQSYSGGGGYITGLIQDTENPHILFARSDVAGVFKSTDGGKSWEAKNAGMTEAHHHSVESICISPHDTNVLFRASGDARNSHTFGTIHKSINSGENWYKVSDSIDYYGNGPDRMYGETIAVDPFNKNFVVAGGYSNGLWVSYDQGESWIYCGLRGERIGLVAFHPYIKDLLYVGTISDVGIFGGKEAKQSGKLKNYLKKHHDYPRGSKGKLFLTTDKGANWKELVSGEGYDFCEIKFHKNNPYLITALFPHMGIFQSFDGGRSFKSITSNLPAGTYCSLEVDPSKENTIYAALYAPGELQKHAPIPIYRTENSGKSWTLIRKHSQDDLFNFPSYIRFPAMAGWAISDIVVDNEKPGKIYYSNWYGVAQSKDGGLTWNAYSYGGLETNCLENIQMCSEKKKVYYTVADHSPVYSIDGGKTYNHLPKNKRYNASSAFTDSRFDKSLIFFGGINRHTSESAIIRVYDHDSLQVVKRFPLNHFVQVLKEDPHRPGTFWAYVDGEMSEAAGLYRSSDWGLSWSSVPLSAVFEGETLPVNKYFIEADLLSIAVYQQKNVNGSNQLLELDPFRKGIIYFGERTDGLFVSSDNGRTWNKADDGLPFKNDTASVLTVIKADPGKEGRIYAGFIKEGLWRSEDFGKKWEKIYPENDSPLNISSLAINPDNSNEIYIAGEPLYWSPSPSVLKVSYNDGEDFRDIYDRSLGALRIKDIAYDRARGRIHIATSGNGCFYVEKKKERRNIDDIF